MPVTSGAGVAREVVAVARHLVHAQPVGVVAVQAHLAPAPCAAGAAPPGMRSRYVSGWLPSRLWVWRAIT